MKIEELTDSSCLNPPLTDEDFALWPTSPLRQVHWCPSQATTSGANDNTLVEEHHRLIQKASVRHLSIGALANCKPVEMHITPHEAPSPVSMDGGVSTRSGKGIRKGSASQLFERQPHPARRSKTKNQNLREAFTKISRPLSEIARERLDIPVVDPARFACRSVEERHMAAKEGGRIKRPLNAFMLYRKTYQEVAKTLCSKTNHQHVSTICGTSWRELEPAGIRKKFEQLAQVEKTKHIEAHPGYKYIPVSGKKAKIDNSMDLVADEEPSDGDDVTAQKRVARGQHKTPAVRSQHENAEPRLYDGYSLELPFLGPRVADYRERDNRSLHGASLHLPAQYMPVPLQYAHSQELYATGGYGRSQGPTFDGIPLAYAGNIDQPGAISNTLQPMTSGYDPLLSGYGGPVSPFAAGTTTIYPPLDSQSGWQPHLATGSGHWNTLELHDAYLSNQDEWKVEELEPGQFDRYFNQQMDDEHL